MSFFKRLFASNAPKRLDHPVFGEAVFIEAKLGSYREAEVDIGEDCLFVAIDAPDQQEPTQSQVEFYERIMAMPDQTFSLVQSVLVPAFENWSKTHFPKDWREVLKLSGLSVPVDGNNNLLWELSFEAKVLNKQLFTCRFESGKPVQVEISG
ncbi:MAG TPA: hypothetical protein VFR90_16435 [Methylibium sp.]|uniref:hypothetical protein n=1 Tax=Methylibium sp. TaxID=2067992 RepID=UPI002DB93DB1|nr:hypothetical protein [Methylibium sp.]HEU4460709.1 hypothetical protein [Methylibium sp.]